MLPKSIVSSQKSINKTADQISYNKRADMFIGKIKTEISGKIKFKFENDSDQIKQNHKSKSKYENRKPKSF